MTRGRLSDVEVEEIRYLSSKGWSNSRIARRLERSISTIQRQQDFRKPMNEAGDKKPTPRRCLKCSETFYAPEPPSIRRICRSCVPIVRFASSNME